VPQLLTLDHKSPHTRVIAMAKIHELRYELLPYSLDLTPSDFNLFPMLKIFLGRPRFSTTEELTAEVEGYFAGLEECHFLVGSRYWNIVGPNALVYRETMLKIKTVPQR
jgi:hypothetical protein